jgi:uncharacterized membrane-anchored protein
MNQRRKLLWLIVAAQFFVLAAMIIQKEYQLATGTRIRLATAPVDPVDLMRGDYVWLSYDISRLDCARIVGCREGYKTGDPVYVELVPSGGVWEAEAISRTLGRRPGAIYLRAHVSYTTSTTVALDYGIESYYVAEHHAGAIQHQFGRGGRESLTAEVVVPASHYPQLVQLYWHNQPLLP